MTHPATFTHDPDPPRTARQQHAAHKERLARLNGPTPPTRFNREEWVDVKIRELTQENLLLRAEIDKLRRWAERSISDLAGKISAIRVVVKDNEAIDYVLEEDNRPSIQKIKRAVCNYFECTPADLESLNRHEWVIQARHIAIYLCRLLTLRSLPEIGRHFGKRDHTTTLHAVRKIERLILKDWTVAFDVAMVEQLI